MRPALRIGLAQVNPTVGDIAGNAELIAGSVKDAEQKGCQLVVFPELTLTGYPPEDLLLKPAFVKDNLKALRDLLPLFKKTAVLLGFVDLVRGARYNAAAWIAGGRLKSVYHKRFLPNYGVFDEERYFEAGRPVVVQRLGGLRIGVTICEDIWMGTAPLAPLKRLRPDLVMNLSASPFHAGKILLRHEVGHQAAAYLKAPLVYCNLVGGQDELVFDGGSFVSGPNGRLALRCPQFKTGVFTFDIWAGAAGRKRRLSRRSLSVQPSEPAPPPLSGVEEIHEALLMGVRDYVKKSGFEKVALGLSGGIDSALVATLAAKALGPQRVTAVTMPSRFNLADTRQDAAELADNLGIRLLEIPIQSIFEKYLDNLAPAFADTLPGLAEENLQARIRGNLLMALSNKFGWLVLTTGNKSEMSTGYCTLYGDTAGGFAVLKDVLKTTVYELAKFINRREGRDLIPQSTIDRPPTAELRENQKDEDSLGSYAQLDPIVVGYVEKNRSVTDLIKENPGKADYVRKIVGMIDKSEYKRRQAPPGIKITPRSFGRDHRMPITNRYRTL